MMPKTYDRLDLARNGLRLVAAAVLAVAVLLSGFAIGGSRTSSQKTRLLIKTLGLCTPALFPAGQALRHAAYANPAVDLRQGPHLPQVVFSPENRLHRDLESER
jgi:hypothetical protein